MELQIPLIAANHHPGGWHITNQFPHLDVVAWNRSDLNGEGHYSIKKAEKEKPVCMENNLPQKDAGR